jgi:hypothetical protein
MCRRDATVLVIPAVACAQHDHRAQRKPAAHGVHHDRTCKIMEGRPEALLQPFLEAEIAVPGNAFKKGIHKGHYQCGGR